MKLSGEPQYDGEKIGFIEGKYYTDIFFALDDVTDGDVLKLLKMAKSEVYTFGFFGSHDIIVGKNNFLRKENKYSSLTGKNIVKIDFDHIGNKRITKIFLHGPKAEEIELKIMRLMLAKSLENLALSPEK
jgi:hypothetical protein